MNDYGNMKRTKESNLRVVLTLTILGTAFLLLISAVVFMYNSQKYVRTLHKSNDTSHAEAQVHYSGRESDNVQNPKPFSYEMKGPPPSGFKSSRISLNRNKNYPQNIQEIIEEQTESSIELTAYSNDFIPTDFQGDRFFKYKPVDMNQINLMAMSNLRFAPPFWENFLKKERQHLGSIIIVGHPVHKTKPAHEPLKAFSNVNKLPKPKTSPTIDVQEVDVVEVMEAS